MIKKTIGFSLLLIFLYFFTGCLPYKTDKGLQIHIQYNKPDFSGKSILILNFKEPNYAKNKGKLAGRIFHETVLKSKIFYLVKLINNSDWNEFGKTEEEMLKTAIKTGKKHKTDFVLAGRITDYVYGGLNKTKVSIRLRIIEVKSGITYFMCSYAKTDIKDDVSHPFKTKMVDLSDLPDKLIHIMANDIIKKITSEKK
jgi:hypothetical protein